jgi:hypothetical protein
LIEQGNTLLLRFEQEITLQGLVYNQMPDLWKLVSKVTYLQLGLDLLPDKKHWTFFKNVVPNGNIASFENRWRWITESMLPLWNQILENEFSLTQYNMNHLRQRGVTAKGSDYPF